jgi:mannose-6-phosphate isomerase-like protein (cupin superfamily)
MNDTSRPVNILDKFALFTEQWTPKIIGELNGQQVKLAKLKDEFVWHSHENEDELFIVMKGTLVMEFRDRTERIGEGEMIIVPRGVEHFPRTENGEEVWVLLFEPKETRHTGEVEHERTVHDQKHI